MQKHRMFEVLREPIEQVPGLEKWSIKQLINPDDPESIKRSPIKVPVAWLTLGEFQLGNVILGVTQEHRMGQPPLQIGFSLQMGHVYGNALLYSANNGQMALLVGEIGDNPDSRMYPLPSPAGAPAAVIEWLEGLAEQTYWDE